MADEIVTISITESPVTIDPVVTETVTITILQTGPQGLKGDTGATGPAGTDAPEVQFEYSDDGSTGWTPTYDANKKYFRSSSDGGSTWSVAIKFEGPAGPTGAPGADGADGVDGNNWLTGSGAPGAGLGVDGDYYLQNDTGDVWLKSGGVWADTGINVINPFDQSLNTTDSPTFVNLTLSGTDSIKIPVGTTAQRNVTPTEGMIRLNSTLNAFEGYKAGSWTSLGGVIDVDQDTYITAEEGADDDTIRIYTAGVERLIVNPSGDVGVGIDPPTEKLHVVGTGLFNSLKLNTAAGDPVAPAQGEIWWNADEWTLNLQQNGSTLQLGHELQYHVHNQTGAQLDNGRPVMFTQAIGASGRGAVDYHDGSDPTKTHLYLGLLTEDIANGGQGKVTRFGRVRGINASGAGTGKLCFGTETWLDGDNLYIDPVNAGYLTNVMPADGQVHIHAAWVLNNNAATGTIFSHANNLDENEFVDYGVLTDWKDPTGWVDNSAITTDYNPTTRKVTLTGDLRYRWRGRLKELTSPYLVDVAHTDADGVYFLYSTDGTTFAWSTTPWEFTDFMVAAVIVLNSTATKIGLREVHGMIVSDAHENFHNYIGTSRISGLGPIGGTYTLDVSTDAATTPGFNSGVIKDEDIKTTIAQTNDGGPYTTLRIGAASAPTFDTAATFPFRYAPGGRIYVNNPATGAETEATNLYYVNVYELLVPVTSDTGSQLYRRLMVQPQFDYQTQVEAEAESTASLDLGLFSLPEFVFYSRLTYRVNASYGNTGKCRLMNITYLAGSRVAQVGIVASGITTPGGADTQIQFNNSGAFDGSSNLTWNSITSNLNVVGTIVASGDITAANLVGVNTGDQDLSSLVTGSVGGNDNAIVRFDTDGYTVQESLAWIDDSGNLTLSGDITCDNGTADTPGFKCLDPINNTYSVMDLESEQCRISGVYRGGASGDICRFDPNTQKVNAIGGLQENSVDISAKYVAITDTIISDTNVAINIGGTGNRYAYVSLYGDDTNNPAARIIRNNSGVNASTDFQHWGTGAIRIQAVEAGNIQLFTSNIERVRLDSAGKFGIGISPVVKLHVKDTASELFRLQTGTAGGSCGYLSLYNSAGARVGILGNVSAASTDFYISHEQSGAMRFLTSSVQRMQITAAGVLDLDYGQIKFPATQNASSDANTLDDYEEGTWTPALSDGTYSDATLTTAIGTYTKIGDIVHATCRVVATSLGSIVGALRITGLPFNTPVSGAARYVCNFGYAINFAITAGHNPTGYAQPNDNYINLLMWDDTGGTTNLTPTEFSADGSIMLSITYKAA